MLESPRGGLYLSRKDGDLHDVLRSSGAFLSGKLFELSSGKFSDSYVQLALLFSSGNGERERVCEALWDKIKEEKAKYDCIVSPAMGGLFLGQELSRISGLPHVFLERDRTKEGSPFFLGRGMDKRLKDQDKILLVDDVMTTGKSLLEAMDALERIEGRDGISIETVACVLDRSTPQLLAKDSRFGRVISLFKKPMEVWDEIPSHLKNKRPIRMSSRPAEQQAPTCT